MEYVNKDIELFDLQHKVRLDKEKTLTKGLVKEE